MTQITDNAETWNFNGENNWGHLDFQINKGIEETGVFVR